MLVRGAAYLMVLSDHLNEEYVLRKHKQNIKYMNRLTFSLILGFTSVHCYSSTQSIGHPGTKWNKNEISVCFGNKSNWHEARILDFPGFEKDPKEGEALPFTSDQKELIKKTVMDSFSAKQTGIFFKLLSDCDQISQVDVILFRFEKNGLTPHGAATMGFHSSYFCEVTQGIRRCGFKRDEALVRKDFVFIDTGKIAPKINKEEKIKRTLLHEFGHVAGLEHEHARLEFSLKDPNCILAGLDRLPPVIREEEGITSLNFSVYDPNSIMNYCFNDTITHFVGIEFSLRAGEVPLISLTDTTLYSVKRRDEFYDYKLSTNLSRLDKHYLRCLYKYNPVEYEGKCHPFYVND